MEMCIYNLVYRLALRLREVAAQSESQSVCRNTRDATKHKVGEPLEITHNFVYHNVIIAVCECARIYVQSRIWEVFLFLHDKQHKFSI